MQHKILDMENEKIYDTDWSYDIWSDITLFHPIDSKLKCRVTRVSPHQAWLMSDDGAKCFLRKRQVKSRWQVTDLTEEMSVRDCFMATVQDYNYNERQLLISLDINANRL